MVLDFSRTHTVTSSVFIGIQEIEKVCDFKYLGTIFSDDLKWHNNSDAIYKKLKSRFYACFKFKSFNPSYEQCQHFIQTLILPILMYNAELWFYSCTEGERNMLLKPFTRAKFNCDIRELVTQRIFRTAADFYRDPDHILNHCYVSHRNYLICSKSRTVRFFNSFVPNSIRILNDAAFMPH